MSNYGFAVFDSEIDTYEDWELMLEGVSIPLPAAQIVSVPIPGMTGELDLTDVLSGYANFNNRLITITFSVLETYDNWAVLISRIANYLHGQKRKLVLDIDPDYYYYGRFAVDSQKTDEALATIVIIGIVDPYKYEIAQQVIVQAVSGTYSLVLQGAPMPVVPVINSTAVMTVTFGGVAYNLAIGNNTIPEVCLVDGANTLLFTGTGTITLTYLRGTF